MKTLEERRVIADIAYCHKILQGETVIPANKLFSLRVARTRGPQMKLVIPRARLNCRRNAFAVRVTRTFSKLPMKMRTATSLASLKRSLATFDLTGITNSVS